VKPQIHSSQDDRIPPPRNYPPPPETRDNKPFTSRPSALDMADRPTSSRPHNPPPPSNSNAHTSSLDEQRAARLAAMQSSASELLDSRNKSLAQRAEKEKMEEERDARMRAKYGQEEVKGAFFKQQTEMGLSEALGRRGGKGLQRM
jgi:hypothetical protein